MATDETFLQLCNQLKAQIGISGNDLTTVSNQTGENKKVVDRIAEADFQIQCRWTDWNFLYDDSSFSVATVSGTKDITVSSTISDLGTWDIESFWLDYTADTHQHLGYLEYDEWKRDYGPGTQTNDKPTRIVVKTDNNLILYPTPDDAYTLTGSYWKTPTKMSTSGGKSAIPARFRRLIVLVAKLFYGEEDDAPEVYQAALNEFRNPEISTLLRALESSELPGQRFRNMSRAEPIVVVPQ